MLEADISSDLWRGSGDGGYKGYSFMLLNHLGGQSNLAGCAPNLINLGCMTAFEIVDVFA